MIRYNPGFKKQGRTLTGNHTCVHSSPAVVIQMRFCLDQLAFLFSTQLSTQKNIRHMLAVHLSDFLIG